MIRQQHETSGWSENFITPHSVKDIKPRANGRKIVGCYMLRLFAHPVACCWMLLRVVAQSLKPVKLFSQQLPTFPLFPDRRSVAQQCWIRLHSSSNIFGATTLITHGLRRLMGCTLPTMQCRSQTCWELLHPFEHHCQHARSNVGSCCARLHGAWEKTRGRLNEVPLAKTILITPFLY